MSFGKFWQVRVEDCLLLDVQTRPIGQRDIYFGRRKSRRSTGWFQCSFCQDDCSFEEKCDFQRAFFVVMAGG